MNFSVGFGEACFSHCPLISVRSFRSYRSFPCYVTAAVLVYQNKILHFNWVLLLSTLILPSTLLFNPTGRRENDLHAGCIKASTILGSNRNSRRKSVANWRAIYHFKALPSSFLTIATLNK